MSMLILLAFLLGAVLGMRFKVFILIPAIGFALIGILAGGIAGGNSVSGTLIAAVLALSCLQIGYLLGNIARYSVALTRAGRPRKASIEAEIGPLRLITHLGIDPVSKVGPQLFRWRQQLRERAQIPAVFNSVSVTPEAEVLDVAGEGWRYRGGSHVNAAGDGDPRPCLRRRAHPYRRHHGGAHPELYLANYAPD